MKFLFTLFVAFIISCTNYYNKMVDWADSIPVGTPIDSVKKFQPDFIKIDWNKPERIDSEIRYEITWIKDNNDPLNMENYLAFVNNKYKARFARK